MRRALPRLRARALALASGAALVLAGALLLGLGRAQTALARPLGLTYNVTSTANAGAGSLRQAIFAANASAGVDTIKFLLPGCPCTILLTNGLPTITDTLIIIGPGADALAVDGGGSHRVFDIDGAPVVLAALTIQNGSVSGSGAGIRSNAPLTLSRVNVLKNTAQMDGGGVYAEGFITLADGHFEGNLSNDSGGGLYAFGGLALSDTEFVSNTADYQGGGVYLYQNGTFEGGRFERNQANTNDGGGLYTTYTVTMTDTEFISNTAGSYAGGLYTGEAVISGGRFEQNSAPGEGGGIYGSYLALTNTAFISNSAGSYAGGLYGSDTVLNGGLVQGNHSGGEAGGVAAGTLVMSGTVLLDNVADGSGAGIYMEGDATVHGARFERNHSDGEGGGLSASGTLTLSASAFFDNTAVQGGGVYARAGSQTNSVFGGNMASDTGSAIYVNTTGLMQLTHLTVAAAAPVSGTAVTLAGGILQVTNTIVSQYALGIQEIAGTASQDYNLFFDNDVTVSGVTGGAHSVNGDPKFVNAAANDYHLGLGSAALDEGTDTGAATDYDGHARPVGEAFDIGFDEALLRVFLTLVVR